MGVENQDEQLRAVWQSQHTESSITSDEIRRRVVQMEKRASRSRYNLYIALLFSSIVVVSIAVLFANWLFLAGAALTVCGFACLAYEVFDHRRRTPAAADGAPPSLEFHRALLQHRLEFHRKRLWLRVLILAPGGLLFFVGFAVARPDLAPFIYFQLATFVVAIMLIVPANRKAAVKVERQINELDRLR